MTREKHQGLVPCVLINACGELLKLPEGLSDVFDPLEAGQYVSQHPRQVEARFDPEDLTNQRNSVPGIGHSRLNVVLLAIDLKLWLEQPNKLRLVVFRHRAHLPGDGKVLCKCLWKADLPLEFGAIPRPVVDVGCSVAVDAPS